MDDARPLSTAVRLDAVPAQTRRAFWLRTLHQWHWISAALSLIGLLLFAATGITLNHAAQIKSKPAITTLKAQLPEQMRRRLSSVETPPAGTALPAELAEWLDAQWPVQAASRTPEWSEGEVYLSLPRPGGDAWLSVSFDTGEVEYEATDRGWISFFNDLHKGRNTGTMWSWFIDLFAVACLVFATTGLFLLQLHSTKRPATWPVVGLGLMIPLLLALLFIH